jgi:hypothetical protein
MFDIHMNVGVANMKHKSQRREIINLCYIIVLYLLDMFNKYI